MSIVEFADVSKRFALHTERSRSLQETLVNLLGRRGRDHGADEFWALRGASFTVERGETFGLVGANGSGKSTALKLIARIIYPTGGKIWVNGRVAALLELGAGFHFDLTGRENVYMNGSILGLKRSAIRRQLDEIVSFSELEQFIDQPIRNYSSGMLMRLGFAVATAFQPDILLVDEVLAVGDQAFQERCQRRIADIQAGGATIILVTHDLDTVRRLCQRAAWLQKGRVRASGPAGDVVNRYLESLWKAEPQPQSAPAAPVLSCGEAAPVDSLSAGPSPAGAPAQPEPVAAAGGDDEEPVAVVPLSVTARWGSGEARIERVELMDESGTAAGLFTSGRPFRVRMWYEAGCELTRPAFGISLHDQHGNRINGPNMVWSDAAPEHVAGRGMVDYIVDEMPLLPGRYDLTVAIYDRDVFHAYDHWHRMATFQILPGDRERQDGLIYVPCRWEHAGTGAPPPADAPPGPGLSGQPGPG